MNDLSTIKTRIQALIAKAQSSEHEAEAAAFMGKAQELLERYQIDLGELKDGDDPVKVFKQGLEMTGKDPTWIKKLYSAVATLYGCKVVYAPTIVRGQWGFRIELTGRESSLVTAELMFPWIKSQCLAEGRRLAKENPGTLTSSQFARRVGNALVQRIYRLAAVNKAAPKTEAAGRNALITLDRVEQVFNEEYGTELKDARSGRVTTNAQAREAANGIGLSRQVHGSSTLAIGSR
jgi:hypothetical protein